MVFKDRASACRFTKRIRDFMTPAPHSIGRDQPLSLAHEKMRGWGIRHLPVLEGFTTIDALRALMGLANATGLS